MMKKFPSRRATVDSITKSSGALPMENRTRRSTLRFMKPTPQKSSSKNISGSAIVTILLVIAIAVVAVVMWRKLRAWAGEVRSEQRQPSFAEWFQWLAERLDQHGKDRTSPPAYERFSGWSPT